MSRKGLLSHGILGQGAEGRDPECPGKHLLGRGFCLDVNRTVPTFRAEAPALTAWVTIPRLPLPVWLWAISKLLHTLVLHPCETELTIAPTSQAWYEVITERTVLHLKQGLAHMVNPQPMAATVNVCGFLGSTFVLRHGGKRLGLTSHISECSEEYQAPYLVRSQKGHLVMPK